jgi:hypothetical protein
LFEAMPSAGDDPANPLTSTEVENDVPTIDAPMSTCEKLAVPIVFTIFVVFRAADRVFLKCVNNALKATAFNLAFGNIIWPFAMLIVTFFMVFFYVLLQRRQGNKQYDCSFFLLGNKNASSMGPIPTYMLALFSLGDQLNAALSSPASAFVSQAIQSVFTNFIIVFMAIVGFFWIKVRFKGCHYLGMALVFVASGVQFLPFLIKNDCSIPKQFPDPSTGSDTCSDTVTEHCTVTCFAAYHSPDQGGEWIKMTAGSMAFFYILFIVSTIPAAVSNVYKQKVLQGVDADIFYVTWWSGFFQLLWGWCCIPMMWIPLPGQPTLPPQDTFSAVWQTFECIAGHDPTGDNPSCAEGTPPWIYVILYFSFNATFNLCITWLIKRISAMWVQIATVLCLNLCNIFSSMRIISGSSAQALTAYDWAGALIVSGALWVYNMQPEVTADGKEILGQASGSFVADGPANQIEKLSGTTPTGSFVKPGSFVKG